MKITPVCNSFCLLIIMISLITLSCNNNNKHKDEFEISLIKAETNFCNLDFDTIFPYHRIYIIFDIRVYNNSDKTLKFLTRDPSDLYSTYFDFVVKSNQKIDLHSDVKYNVEILPRHNYEFKLIAYTIGHFINPHDYYNFKSQLKTYLDNPLIQYNYHVSRKELLNKLDIKLSPFYFIKFDCTDKWKNGWD